MTQPSKPTTEQWAELYEAAKAIKKLEPWKHLWEDELTVIMLPEQSEPVFVSAMGRIGECFAIGVYPGYGPINSFYRLKEAATDGMPPVTMAFEQDCLACNFGDREEVEPEDREAYKALGLKFRGRGEWIYFRSMEPGHFPWHIDYGQAEIMRQALTQYVICMEEYLSDDGVDPDFDEGEVILRAFSDGEWRTSAAMRPPIPMKRPKLVVDDMFTIARLKKSPQSRERLDFELAYLPIPIQEEKGDKPRLPRLALLMDRESGSPLGQHMAPAGDPIEAELLGMITGYIERQGRPASINVRDNVAGRYIEDFCKKLGIEYIEGEGVPAADYLLEGFLGGMDDME